MKLARKGHLNGTLTTSTPSRGIAIISGYVMSGQFNLIGLELSWPLCSSEIGGRKNYDRAGEATNRGYYMRLVGS